MNAPSGFTPTPWSIDQTFWNKVRGANGDPVAEVYFLYSTGREEAQANAARIVYAVNNIDARDAEIAGRRAEVERLSGLLNNPYNHDFLIGAVIEAGHQIERWGAAHDRGKEAADWYWLVGYLAGKALAAQLKGDTDKALHHTISTAAALANWHNSITGNDTRMRPGLSDLQQRIADAFGLPAIDAARDTQGGG